MKPEDVPGELTETAYQAYLRAPKVSINDVSIWGYVLAEVLPEARKTWFAELFGTREEIAAREAEAAQRTPDDTVRLCEMARPGEHERRVREQVAAEARDTAARLDEGPQAATLYQFADRLARGEAR